MIKDRVEWIDRAKGITIILVVLGHVLNDMPNDNGEYSFLINIIYSFHMPCFFIISGLVTTDNEKPLKSRCIKLSKQLLLPYLFFSFLFLIKAIITNILQSVEWKESFANNWKDTVLVTSKSEFASFWFLPCLFISKCLLICLLRNTKKPSLILLCFPISFIISYVFSDYTMPFMLDAAILSTGFLYIGVSLRKKHKCLKHKKAAFVLVLSIFIICNIFSYFVLHQPKVSFFEMKTGNPILLLIASTTGSLTVFSISKALKKEKIIVKIGTKSLWIYGFHYFIMAIIKRLLLFVKADTFPLGFIFAELAITVLIGMGLATIINTVLKKEKRCA